MFSRIKKTGDFTFKSGVRSSYDYDYGSLTDSMNSAFCQMLLYKLETWQNEHGKLNVVAGIETEGIRIAYELSRLMSIPFIIVPHERNHFAQLEIPQFSADTHWLIVDDVVTTGQTFVRAISFLDVEEKPETLTFACMIKRNPFNLDYSGVPNESHVVDRRFDFIDRRLVSLYDEPE